jgi:hypothetical protein
MTQKDILEFQRNSKLFDITFLYQAGCWFILVLISSLGHCQSCKIFLVSFNNAENILKVKPNFINTYRGNYQ